jgi:hypothetical protein
MPATTRNRNSSGKKVKTDASVAIIGCLIACLSFSCAYAADRIIIGNVSRTVEQLPNAAARPIAVIS